MGEYRTDRATTTDTANTVTSYSVNPVSLDTTGSQKETSWYFDKATANLGYYKNIPELKKSIDALAMWTVGKGFSAQVADSPILDKINGWGEDSFTSIMWNMIVIKKAIGDSFAEIIRNDNQTLVNLKPISPERVKIVVDGKGIIKRYEYLHSDGKTIDRKIQPKDMLHLSNDRVGDEIHGTSVIDACKWVIDARNEAMDTYRKIMKRQLAYGILEVEEDNETKMAALIKQYQNAVDNGEVLVLPKDVAEIKESKISIQDFLSWISYLENFFYQAVGIPKIILGGSADFTEASSKVGYLTFEQVYIAEQRELEADLWNQLAIKLEFERPVSLKDDVADSEAKNTSQVGFQNNDVQAQVGRVE